MDQSKFETALDLALSREPRYDRAAYYFLREGLDFTLCDRKKASGEVGHVSGQQLLDGIRKLALKQFGPMVTSVFEYWGIQNTEDFGNMVFALIDVGVFGKSDQDSIESFRAVYSFQEAFVAPYLPSKSVVLSERKPAETPEAKLN